MSRSTLISGDHQVRSHKYLHLAAVCFVRICKEIPDVGNMNIV